MLKTGVNYATSLKKIKTHVRKIENATGPFLAQLVRSFKFGQSDSLIFYYFNL